MSRVCVITGASSGIGLAAARQLAAIGYELLLICRDRHRGEMALVSLRNAVRDARVELLLADLSNQREIRRAAQRVNSGWSKIRLLVNNAGVGYLPSRLLTSDGLELTYAVNCLAPFLLTHLLLPALWFGAPSRVVNVACDCAPRGTIRIDDLQWTNNYSGPGVTRHSKLVLTEITREFARRISHLGITFNCVHPGATRTNLYSDLPLPLKLFRAPLKTFFRSPDAGAEPIVRLADDPDLQGVTAAYFERFKQKLLHRTGRDEAMAQRVWDDIAQLCGLVV